jgi:glutathione-regulated potassium-efflux system protein KefB
MSLLLQLLLVLACSLVVLPLAHRWPWLQAFLLIAIGILLSPNVLHWIDLQGNWLTIRDLTVAIFCLYAGLQINPNRLLQTLRKPMCVSAWPFALGTLVLSLLFYIGANLEAFVAISLAMAALLCSPFFTHHVLKHDQRINRPLEQLSSFIRQGQWLLLIPIIATIQLFSGADTAYHALAYCMLLVAFMSGFWLFNTHIMQPLLQHVVRLYGKTYLLPLQIFSVLLVLVVAQSVGVHPAIACLFAGMLLANSSFDAVWQHGFRTIRPMLFGLIFIFMGASVNITLVQHYWDVIALSFAVIFVVKFLSVFVWAKWLNQSWSAQGKLALNHAHMGELSFIILVIAKSEQLIGQSLFSIAVMTLLLSIASIPLIHALGFLPLKKTLSSTSEVDTTASGNPPLAVPLIIAGFGRVGQLLARIAHLKQQGFIAIDHQIQQADFIENYGGKLLYADATTPEILIQANIQTARLFVIAIDDIEDSMNLARHLKLNYPQLRILARAHDRHHAYLLQQLGVDYIWQETYASSLEMAYRMLCDLDIAPQHAKATIHAFRQHDAKLQAQDNALYSETQRNAMQVLESLFQEDLILQFAEPNSLNNNHPHAA